MEGHSEQAAVSAGARRAHILVLSTGSVACVKVPALVVELQKFAEVRVVCTEAAFHFLRNDGPAEMYDPAAFAAWQESGRSRFSWPPVLDEDEWGYSKVGEPVLHIELRKWADVLLIAPLSANTLAKLASGICDNLATSVVRAWDTDRPIVLAPAMNSLMWEHPLTQSHLGVLNSVYFKGFAFHSDSSLRGIGLSSPDPKGSFHRVASAVIGSARKRTLLAAGAGNDSEGGTGPVVGSVLTILQPQEQGTLACGDVGKGKMAEVEDIVARLKQVCSGIYLGLAGERGGVSGGVDVDVARSLNRAFSAALRRTSSGGSESPTRSDRPLSIPSRALLALESEEAEEKEGRLDDGSAEDKECGEGRGKNENEGKGEGEGENEETTPSGDRQRDQRNDVSASGTRILWDAQSHGGARDKARGIRNNVALDYVARFAFLCFLFVMLEGLLEFLAAQMGASALSR